jgi:hypothetical protein
MQPLSNSGRKQRGTYPLQLPKVQEVVTRIQAAHVLEALLAPFAVEPNSLQIRWAQTLPKTQVGPTERDELLQGVLNLDIAVPEATGPEILIVARERGPIVREHHAEPEAAYEFRVREVLNDLANRPLAWRFWHGRDVRRHGVEELLKCRGSLAEDRDRLLLTEQLKKRGDVSRDVSRTRRSWIAEDAHRGVPPTDFGSIISHDFTLGFLTRHSLAVVSQRLFGWRPFGTS